MRAALIAVASAPPKRFAGGGYWEAMKGEMTGWFEVRVDGPGRHHYRLLKPESTLTGLTSGRNLGPRRTQLLEGAVPASPGPQSGPQEATR
ncbi:hypothetical protein BN11_240004 [Nostocoides australiense Ben110]|uniref:Uncharacterized protein n=1 Tax=Nostocoides australiense Ben110 TaxID=1193182 RepID=W6JUS9_9MICO|nr:hypothetical protein BN11_240004 [Tetrasphaera australiensis Ben110]